MVAEGLRQERHRELADCFDEIGSRVASKIKDLVNFLNSAGGKLKWIGKRTIQINGVKFLNSIN